MESEAASGDLSSSSPLARGPQRVEFPEPNPAFRIWSDEELAAAKKSDPEPSPVADAFRAAMVLFYARYQSEVGRKVRRGFLVCSETAAK